MIHESLSLGGRAAHDLGLATFVGGSVFGQFALNPAVARIGEPADRGAVINAAWGTYNGVNALALTAVTVGWFASRVTETAPSRLSDRERSLALAKDALTLTAVGAGVVSGVHATRFAKAVPGGAVPIESGVQPGPETPPEAARAQRGLRLAGIVGIVAGVGMTVVNALLAQTAHTRPPLRRALLRRSA